MTKFNYSSGVPLLLLVIVTLGVVSSDSWNRYKARLDHSLKRKHIEDTQLEEDTSILESRKAKRILAHRGFRGEEACSCDNPLRVEGNLKGNCFFFSICI